MKTLRVLDPTTKAKRPDWPILPTLCVVLAISGGLIVVLGNLTSPEGRQALMNWMGILAVAAFIIAIAALVFHRFRRSPKQALGTLLGVIIYTGIRLANHPTIDPLREVSEKLAEGRERQAMLDIAHEEESHELQYPAPRLPPANSLALVEIPRATAGQFITREVGDLAITFPATWSIRPYAGAKLYALASDPFSDLIVDVSQSSVADDPLAKGAFMEECIEASKKPASDAELIVCDLAKIGKNSGLFAIFNVDHKLPNRTLRLRTMSFQIFRHTTLYTVTCRCSADDMETAKTFGPVFDTLAFKD